MNDVLALCLDGGGQDMALVAEAARLAALDALACEAQFDFLVYQKL